MEGGQAPCMCTRRLPLRLLWDHQGSMRHRRAASWQPSKAQVCLLARVAMKQGCPSCAGSGQMSAGVQILLAQQLARLEHSLQKVEAQMRRSQDAKQAARAVRKPCQSTELSSLKVFLCASNQCVASY